MASRRHTRAFAAAERFSFPPSKSSLHPENQSAGCFFMCRRLIENILQFIEKAFLARRLADVQTGGDFFKFHQ